MRRAKVVETPKEGRKRGEEKNERALDQAIGEKATVKALISKRFLEIRDLNNPVEMEKVVCALLVWSTIIVIISKMVVIAFQMSPAVTQQ